MVSELVVYRIVGKKCGLFKRQVTSEWQIDFTILRFETCPEKWLRAATAHSYVKNDIVFDRKCALLKYLKNDIFHWKISFFIDQKHVFDDKQNCQVSSHCAR